MTDLDFEEMVDLHGLPPDTPMPLQATVYHFGKLKTTILAEAVREVIDDWSEVRKMTAMIHRDSGADLQIEDIGAIYERSDFPHLR